MSESEVLKKLELAESLANYILLNDSELEDYCRHCKENNLSEDDNNLSHIVGIAREYLK